MISNTLLNLTTRLNETLCNEAGIWIPFIDESQIPLAVRAFLYLMGLLVVFFGIALASDLLMCSIGRITTQTIIRRNSTGNLVEEHLWNPTVANLTLLALGTSAPEILLSTIEVTSKGMKLSYLGPGSVIGSSAFNLFIITAVCISSIQTNSVRRVSEIKVYCVTMLYSMTGYGWIFLIIHVITPSVIDVWEAFATLLLFFGLIISAYFCANTSNAIHASNQTSMANTESQFGRSVSETLLDSNEDLLKTICYAFTDSPSSHNDGIELSPPSQNPNQHRCLWKLVSYIFPSPNLLGGYPAFLLSLVVTGVLVTLVIDMASRFACLTGLTEFVVGTTLLAVGTSLPELFTSRLAAIRFKHADHSMGNILGSNCINVFIGLGLPWLIAAVYWRVRKEHFYIDEKLLSFDISLLFGLIIVFILFMILRRNLSVFGKAEFGGPTVAKMMSTIFLSFLWVAYVSLYLLIS